MLNQFLYLIKLPELKKKLNLNELLSKICLAQSRKLNLGSQINFHDLCKEFISEPSMKAKTRTQTQKVKA